MDEQERDLYHSDSGYYSLPRKRLWACSKNLYIILSYCLAIIIGLVAAYFLSPVLFNTKIATVSLLGAYYQIFAFIAPGVLFLFCIWACVSCNRKMFSVRGYGPFYFSDLLYVGRMVILYLLKGSLAYLLFTVLAPVVLLVVFVFIALKSVFHILGIR